MKKERGITLIALIITIIVLLILAGITINFVLGDNGLFKTAKEAGEKYDEAGAREKLETVLLSLQADKYTDPKYNEKEYIDNRIIENNMNISGDLAIVDGWQFSIDRSVPKIAASLGKGKESSNINIASVIEYTENFKKGTITLTITSKVELSIITINGENISTTNNNNGTYTIIKDIEDNGTYSVYVKDINDEYKLKNVKVLGIQKDIIIYTIEDLIQFVEIVNKGGAYEGKTVTLANDLDLKNVCYKVDGTTQNDINWTPIGTQTNQFKGIFEGNNKEISNIYINSSSSNQALFGSLGTTGIVKNLKVRGTISGSNNCAGIICKNYGKVENCVNYASVTTSGSSSGGIAGHNWGIIYRCINNGNITATNETSGGIAATNGYGVDLRSFIIECINNGNVTSSSWVSAGIAGCNGEQR